MERVFIGKFACLVLGLLCVFLNVHWITVSAQESGDRAAALEEQIHNLRRDGEYAAALERARELHALGRQAEDAKPHEVISAQWLVATLERVVGFSEEERREYALAVSLGRPHEVTTARMQVQILRDLLGSEHPDVATSLNRLAKCLTANGDHGEAERFLHEALAIYRKTMGEEHPHVTTGLNNLAVLLTTVGDLDGAESLYREALALSRKALGLEHPDVALRLSNLGVLLIQLGDYDGAESLYREALTISRKALRPDHPDLAYDLNGLGMLLIAQGKYEEAEPFLREALNIWRETLGPDHRDVATGLASLGRLHFDQGDYSGAEPFYRDAIVIWRQTVGSFHHAEMAGGLVDLGRLLANQEDYTGARPILDEALAIQRRVLGPEHIEVAETLNLFARLRQEQADYPGAESLYLEALDISRKHRGPESLGVSKCLYNLAGLFRVQGHYTRAESLYREALTVSRKILGAEHPSVLTNLVELGTLLQYRGDYPGAETILAEALSIRRKILGPDDPNLAVSFIRLGGLLYARGQYAEAESNHRKALAIICRTLGPDHYDAAVALGELGAALEAQGDYASAVQLMRESLVILRKAWGPGHPAVATALNNLGMLLDAQGDHEGAEPLLREALTICRETFDVNHPSVARCTGNLGQLRMAQGDHAGAELLMREVLELLRQAYGSDHPHVSTALVKLGVLLATAGEREGAEPLLREALEIGRKTLGEDHPLLATIFGQLGRLLVARGDLADAEPLLREDLTIKRATLGQIHPEVAHSICTLALLRHLQGDHNKTEVLLTQAAEIHDVARLRAGPSLERATFAQGPHQHLAVVRLAVGKRDEAWSAAEKAQARTLTDLLLNAGQRELSPLESTREDSLQRLQASLERQVEFLQEAARTDSASVTRQQVEETRTQLFATQAALGDHLREVAANHPITDGEHYPLDRVQIGLQEERALIGWLDVCWDDWQAQGGCDSWCYVIRHTGPVLWARTQPRAEVTDTLSAGSSPFDRAGLFRRDLLMVPHSGSTAAVSQRGHELWTERIRPIAHALEGVKELIVIPSGAMLGIPLETLVDPEGAYVGDRFTVSYTPSATIHTWLAERAAQREGQPPGHFLLVGDPPFSAEPMIAAASTAPDRSLIRGVLVGNETALARLGELPLPHTRIEVDRIVEVCPQAEVLLGADASEQRFVELAESGRLREFDVIHVATHAFADNARAERSALILSQVDLPDAREAALAGTRIYDGRLTVKEVLQEWELDADLVTLSACQTGLGEEIYGEGLVGFAHAFLQKGAQSLLLSLWNVQDKATSLLMERFYENLLGAYTDERAGHIGDPMTKVEALQEAKRYLRNYTGYERGKHPYEHPYYWAPFILIGDGN